MQRTYKKYARLEGDYVGSFFLRFVDPYKDRISYIAYRSTRDKHTMGVGCSAALWGFEDGVIWLEQDFQNFEIEVVAKMKAVVASSSLHGCQRFTFPQRPTHLAPWSLRSRKPTLVRWTKSFGGCATRLETCQSLRLSSTSPDIATLPSLRGALRYMRCYSQHRLRFWYKMQETLRLRSPLPTCKKMSCATPVDLLDRLQFQSAVRHYRSPDFQTRTLRLPQGVTLQ